MYGRMHEEDSDELADAWEMTPMSARMMLQETQLAVGN